LSTDAENTRVIVDAAERIEAIIQKRDTEHAAEIERIRRAMNRATAADLVRGEKQRRYIRRMRAEPQMKPWIQRLADWLNGR